MTLPPLWLSVLMALPAAGVVLAGLWMLIAYLVHRDPPTRWLPVPTTPITWGSDEDDAAERLAAVIRIDEFRVRNRRVS